jgi:hypothetical protein
MDAVLGVPFEVEMDPLPDMPEQATRRLVMTAVEMSLIMMNFQSGRAQSGGFGCGTYQAPSVHSWARAGAL